MNPIRVLLITRECLRTDSNEGNVLLNLFDKQPMVLANIYCKPGLPNTEACIDYFQLTDQMAMQNIRHKTPMGQRVQPQLKDLENEAAGERENKVFYDFFRTNNWPVFHCIRELLWKLADFKSQALNEFVVDFSPDVIFAPMCYSMFVLALQRHIIGLTNVPAVTFLYDDLYSLRQWRFSPIYWINRFLQRRAIRKTISLYEYAYTMTEQQAMEYKRMLNIPMNILRKCASGPIDTLLHKKHKRIRFLYAGGLYFGRDKTLIAVADALRSLRKEGYQTQLDIYTASPLSRTAQKKLNDGDQCTVHSTVSYSDLQQVYQESDIALHVESFQNKYALMTRLSFSTKIVDCLESGCAVLAICPDINAGWQYLRDEDAAVCITALRDIPTAVRTLVLNRAKREEYVQKGRDCLQRNHQKEDIRPTLLADLTAIAGQKGMVQ